MTILLALLLIAPLAGAAVVLLLPTRRVPIGIATALGVLVGAALLLADVADGSRTVLAVGNLTPPLGIVLVADGVGAIAAVVSSAVLLAVQVALVGTAADRWPGTRAALLALTTGVMLAFVTGDLFTLFVAFEIVLLASYVLLTRARDADGVRVAPLYVTANLVASAVFLLAIAGVYGATGQVNLAAVAAAWPDVDPAVRDLLGGALALVFATKAALLPLGLWLPATYAALPPVIGAAAGAILTKVGVVALVRLVTLLPPSEAFMDGLLIVALVTMLGGVAVALGEDAVHRVLSAHVISQVGFMLVGVSLVTTAGLAGTMIYLAHHVLVKGALLLVAAGLFARAGTLRLASLRGVQRRAPLLAVLFCLAAAALAGLPPTSGFVAKVALLRAGIEIEAWLAVAGMGLGSVLTLVSMTKVHVALLGDRPSSAEPAGSAQLTEVAGAPAERSASVGAAGLVTASLALALFGGPAYEAAVAASTSALDISSYITEVGR